MPSAAPASWLPIALSIDLPPSTVVPAATPSGTLALWRSASGKLSLAADRCPHRGMRLSYGFVRDEALSCIYHGWRYASNGRCLKIPAHPDLEPPAAIKVQTYSVIEKDGLIWMSFEALTDTPPDLAGFIPLRTILCETDVDAIFRKGKGLAGVEKSIILPLANQDCLLLAVSLPDERCLLHVFAPADASVDDKVAISRALEAWRIGIEAQKEFSP